MPTVRTSESQADAEKRLTPAMRQYARFKKQHPDCVLFFRMGDFYEMFYDDALLCHRELGITLTQRTEGVPMAGVPFHAVENYLRKMIERGHRVAVCEQVEDPRHARGVVKRAVTRVLTPGTLVDDALLDESRANQIGAVQFVGPGDAAPAVLALAELSTGSFTLHDLPAEGAIDEIVRLGPSELIHVESADGAVPTRVRRMRDAVGCALTARPAWFFRLDDARECLRAHFGVARLTGFGLEEADPAIGPAGALLRYLVETQGGSDGEGDGARLAHLRPPRRLSADDFVTIDATSLASLEVERTMRSGQTSGSLLSSIQRCRTSMGKRLLRQWLCFPSRDLDTIRARQRCVAALLEDRRFESSLRDRLGRVQDVARIAGRVSMRRASPRDLVALGRSLAEVSSLEALLEGRPAFAPRHERMQALAGTLKPLAEAIATRCVDAPPAHLREGGLFRDGVDATLDEARGLMRDGTSWLASYQKRLIGETGIGSLKVGYNKVFGYYIEVTHVHGERVPPAFTRKQTLKNAERYITPELKTFEEKVTTAEARAIEREQILFERLCRDAAAHIAAVADFAAIVAELDVLGGFAEVAAKHGYVRPEVIEEPVLDIRQGRHPVLDQVLAERFVPNDCVLGRSRPTGDDAPESSEPPGAPGASLALITGPNMAGKSTCIRQVALIVLLAHTGSSVPAEAATIGLTDRIFTRIGASDELHTGQSTFMVEMTETANILHHATPASVVILDEIGRGTSTLDGLSLAWAIAEALASVGCRTLFATHYHELTGLADRLENVRNLHVAVREWGDEIVFLYRILPGRTDRSYGIHVAKLAGIPTDTIDRATTLLETLAVQTDSAEMPPAGGGSGGSRAAPKQLSLFTEYVEHPALAELRELKLDGVSPLQAFDLLRDLCERLRQ